MKVNTQLRELRLQLYQDSVPLTGQAVDFGRVRVGEEKEIEIRGVSREKGRIENLRVLHEHPEVTERHAIPLVIKTGDDFYCWLKWRPTGEKEEGLTLNLDFMADVIFG